MSLYELHVRSADPMGFGMIETIVELANGGATIKEGVLPRLSFPHSIILVIETEEEPTPTPTVRVFNMSESAREILIESEENQASSFSMSFESAPTTKEELDKMEFKDFRELCKTVGVKGRDRTQMTREYIKAKESQE